MRIALVLVFFIIIGILGCSSDKDVLNSDANNIAQGEWKVSLGEVAEDSCNLAALMGILGANDDDSADQDDMTGLLGNSFDTIEITTMSKKLFVISAEGDIELECTLDGDDYVCDPLETSPIDLSDLGDVADFPVNASLEISVVTEGTFTAKDETDGLHKAEVECNGISCILLSNFLSLDFPCTLDMEFTAQFQGD